MAPSLRNMALSLVTAVSLVVHQSSALQVTPNSPCSAECIDSSDLDISDPNSSNTITRQIVCEDGQYDTKQDGIKFKKCMSCLQNSTYSQGSESDQGWFLYNMRYAFDYCILGYPNATSMGTNPCRVPEACGHLSRALETGIMNPAGSDRLAYCDGGADTSSYWDSCRGCVKADGQHAYLSNFLTALEAGCKQRPSTDLMLGVNETVFTTHAIKLTDPSKPNEETNTSKPPLTMAAIVGIAIGAFVILCLAAGCIFMQCRKRKNRAKRAQRVLSFQRRSIGVPRQLQPQQVEQEDTHYKDTDYDDERFFAEKDAAVEYNPDTMASMSPVARSKPYLWNTSPAPSSNDSKGKARDGRQLNVTTNVLAPPPAHTSPRMVSPDDFASPTSTVSTRSNAPLLDNQLFVATGMAVSPEMSASPAFAGSSPAIGQSQFVHGGSRGVHPARDGQSSSVGQPRDLGGRRGRGPLGSSPVQMTAIQTKFAPPPSR